MFGCSDAPEDHPPVWFGEEAAARGLDFRHVSGAEGRYWTPEIMTGGVALADVDGDGDLDAYLVQGGSLTGGEDSPGKRTLPERRRVVSQWLLNRETRPTAATGWA